MRKTTNWEPGMSRFLKEILHKNHKLRFGLILLIGLWIVAGTKFVTEHIVYRERNLKEAFAAAQPQSTTGTVSFAAKISSNYLTEADQKELICFVAERIGLTLSSEPVRIEEEEKNGFFYRKKAKQAETLLKVLGIRERDGQRSYYLIVTIALAEDDGDKVLFYRNRLDEIARELEVTEKQLSLQLTGRFDDRMSLAEKDRIADRMLAKLGCETVCENREESLYTIYAYTKGIDEYILSGNRRINVQLAMYYDEIREETVVCLASPVITADTLEME